MIHVHQARLLETAFNRYDDHFYAHLCHIRLQQFGGLERARVPRLGAGRHPKLQREVFCAQRFQLFTCFCRIVFRNFSLTVVGPRGAR